jgi:hypothetical protein
MFCALGGQGWLVVWWPGLVVAGFPLEDPAVEARVPAAAGAILLERVDKLGELVTQGPTARTWAPGLGDRWVAWLPAEYAEAAAAIPDAVPADWR